MWFSTVRVRDIFANNIQNNSPVQGNEQAASGNGGRWWSGTTATNNAWQNDDSDQDGNATNNLNLNPAPRRRYGSGNLRVNDINANNIQTNAPTQQSWQTSSANGSYDPWWGWGGGGTATNNADQTTTNNQNGNATNNINVSPRWSDVRVSDINATNVQTNAGTQFNGQSASGGTATNNASQSSSNYQSGSAVNNINIFV